MTQTELLNLELLNNLSTIFKVLKRLKIMLIKTCVFGIFKKLNYLSLCFRFNFQAYQCYKKESLQTLW